MRQQNIKFSLNHRLSEQKFCGNSSDITSVIDGAQAATKYSVLSSLLLLFSSSSSRLDVKKIFFLLRIQWTFVYNPKLHFNFVFFLFRFFCLLFLLMCNLNKHGQQKELEDCTSCMASRSIRKSELNSFVSLLLFKLNLIVVRRLQSCWAQGERFLSSFAFLVWGEEFKLNYAIRPSVDSSIDQLISIETKHTLLAVFHCCCCYFFRGQYWMESSDLIEFFTIESNDWGLNNVCSVSFTIQVRSFAVWHEKSPELWSRNLYFTSENFTRKQVWRLLSSVDADEVSHLRLYCIFNLIKKSPLKKLSENVCAVWRKFIRKTSTSERNESFRARRKILNLVRSKSRFLHRQLLFVPVQPNERL